MSPRRYVGFVRAVMIGREGLHRSVLLDIIARAGGAEAVSYISTGNVSFLVEPRALDGLVAQAEAEIEQVVGRRCEVFVRSGDEMIHLLSSDPFAVTPMADPIDLSVTFFRDSVPESLVLPFWSPRRDFVVFGSGPREVFSVGRDVDGRRQAPGGTIERLAGERVTTRAWSTIERIVARLT